MMNNYMPKSFEEILVHPQNKLSILNFFTDIIKFNNDPILNKELEYICNYKNPDEYKTIDSLKSICVILGIQGSGKTTLIKYLCEKLNIRQCYYENEPIDYINNIRGMNERESNNVEDDDDNSNRMNDNYYEHPYINFLLYSNCIIGNTKKDKTQARKKRNDIIQNKKYIGKNSEQILTCINNNSNNYIDGGDNNPVSRCFNHNENYDFFKYNSTLDDRFPVLGKKRLVDSNTHNGPNKFVKIFNSNNINYRGIINNSLASNNHNINNNINSENKEMIIENLIECNHMIIQLIKLLFILYDKYMHILKDLLKYSECMETEKKSNFLFFSQNRFYKIINKKFLLCVKIFKKINNILSVLHNIKDIILKRFNDYISIEKQHLINLFVDGNYNEEMIEALNKLYHTIEVINITIKQSNDISFYRNKNLDLYNKLKVELIEEWDMRATLIEEMKDYIERKNINKQLEKYIQSNNIIYTEKDNSICVTIPMINEENINDFYITKKKYTNNNKYNNKNNNKNKNKNICRDSSTCTGSDDSTCLDNNSVKSPICDSKEYINNILTNNTLNNYIEHFIDINRSKNIIKELCVTNNLKNILNENYLHIIENLNKNVNDINNINYIEINKGKIHFPHFMILPKDINDILIINKKEKKCSLFNNENILIQLLMINNYNINFINNFNLKNIIKEFIIIHMLLIINIKDIITVNLKIVNHIKMDVINNLIMTNNLIKKKKNFKNDYIFGKNLLDKLTTISLKNKRHVETKYENITYDDINNIKEFEERKSGKDSITQNDKYIKENKNVTKIKITCSFENSIIMIKESLNVSKKINNKLITYSYEIYKLNNNIINNLIQNNRLYDDIIKSLNNEIYIKDELMSNFVDIINIQDEMLDFLFWILSNNSNENVMDIIMKSILYKKVMDIDIKEKKKKEKERIFYDNHFINTRAIIIDELPISELEYSEAFRNSCISTMQFILNRINYCKEKILKYKNRDINNIKEKNETQDICTTNKNHNNIICNGNIEFNTNCYMFGKDNLECFKINPMIILINSYDQIKTVNSLLGLDINNSPYVHFIKLKKIHPAYFEKILIERYYYKMIHSNKYIKDVIKNYAYNCNGDIRSCFNALDLLNRIPNISQMNINELNNISNTYQNDIFHFVKSVLYNNIPSHYTSRDDIISPLFYLNFHTHTKDEYFSNWINHKHIKIDKNYMNDNIINISSKDNLNHKIINNDDKKDTLVNHKMKDIHILLANNKEEKNDVNSFIKQCDIHPIDDDQNICMSNRNYNNDKIIQNNKNINSYENYQTLLKELDNQSEMMSIFEKFQIVSLLKENYLYFYNNLFDVAKLFTNLSIIEYSFCGFNCTNLLMRKSFENQNGDVSRFINDHFMLTYMYFMICNSNIHGGVLYGNNISQKNKINMNINDLQRKEMNNEDNEYKEKMENVEKNINTTIRNDENNNKNNNSNNSNNNNNYYNNNNYLISLSSMDKKLKINNHISIQPQSVYLKNIFFSFKNNPMYKYYHHCSILRKELYDRYIMIVIRKLTNEYINDFESVLSKYCFLLRANHELFSSIFPSYILLIINYWNGPYINEYNLSKYEELKKKNHCDNTFNNEYDNKIFINKIESNNFKTALYSNKVNEIIDNFTPSSTNCDNRKKHINEIILFLETFITPKFIALFFPSYLKYLKDGTKQKKCVLNFIGNQAVSIETYFEMRNILKLNDIAFFNYFFQY
ncbi:conserved Plasmodium protein, unknown function [Plasmodium gaboni]|uniref:Dynein heavy chain n=1 Tax=Plasmodium gaboni TaxID=647221 RepID=A0ABY1UQT4_9APIC|nr:conserved Plasmodium protein, unknown function [Plasmodium gaboni]